MALRITEVKYTDLKGRELTFPVGNTGNTITAKYTMDCEFRIELSNSLQVVKNGTQLTLVGSHPDGGELTWEAFGITPGVVNLGLYPSGGTPITGTATITSVQGPDAFTSADISTGVDETILVGNFKQFKTPEGFDLYFNISPNDSKTKTSPIDGGVQRFQIDNVQFTPVGTTLTMNQLGTKSGASDLLVELKILENGLADKSRFELYVTYRYPNYLDSSLFSQDGTVTPYLEVYALAQFANPNARLKRVHEPDGNVGYFDEHFNGGLSTYTPISIAWTNLSGQPISAMDFGQTSNFEAVIEGNFDTNCQFNIGWFWYPSNEEYYKGDPNNPGLPTSHDQNVMLVTKTTANSVQLLNETLVGYANASGAQLTITNLTYTIVGSGPGSIVRVTGRTVPNAAFTQWFETREGDRRVVMWIDCDESAYNYDWNSSTSTNVEIYDDQMIENPTPLGAWDDIQYSKFLDHNDDEFTSPKVYTEDDLNLVVRFRLPKNIQFNTIAASVVAYNTVSGQEFTLESTVIDVSVFPFLPDGSAPISYLNNRGFKQPNGSGKNEIRLSRYPSNDTSLGYGLELNYGFLCRWEYWLQQLNAAPVFFNSANKNWQQYSGAPGWGVKVKMEITNDTGTYTNGFPFYIRAYDDYGGTSIVRFLLLDNTVVAAPPSDQISIVEFTHTIDSPYVWDGPYWANHRVEQYEGGPSWMLSSRNFPLDPACPLSPLPGEVGVEITVTGDEAVTKCLFDPSKLSGALGLSFNGRIQGNETPDKVDEFVYQNGEQLLTQGGDILENQ